MRLDDLVYAGHHTRPRAGQYLPDAAMENGELSPQAVADLWLVTREQFENSAENLAYMGADKAELIYMGATGDLSFRFRLRSSTGDMDRLASYIGSMLGVTPTMSVDVRQVRKSPKEWEFEIACSATFPNRKGVRS